MKLQTDGTTLLESLFWVRRVEKTRNLTCSPFPLEYSALESTFGGHKNIQHDLLCNLCLKLAMLTVSEPTFQYFCLEVPAIEDSDFAPPGVHYLDLHDTFKYSSCVFINVALRWSSKLFHYYVAWYISMLDIYPLRPLIYLLSSASQCITHHLYLFTGLISNFWPFLLPEGPFKVGISLH